MTAYLNIEKRTLICYAGPTSKTLIDSKPIGDELAAAIDLNGPKSQLLVDNMGQYSYQNCNRTRHASQRCAPGGSFFALNMGDGGAA